MVASARMLTPTNRWRNHVVAPNRWVNTHANPSMTANCPSVNAVRRIPGDSQAESANAAMNNAAMTCAGLTAGTAPRRSAVGYTFASTQRPPQTHVAAWNKTTRSTAPSSDANGSRALNLGGPDISARNRRLSNQFGARATRVGGTNV